MKAGHWRGAALLVALMVSLTGCGDDGAAEPTEGDGLQGVLVDVHREPG